MAVCIHTAREKQWQECIKREPERPENKKKEDDDDDDDEEDGRSH